MKNYSEANIALVICYCGKLPWYFHYFVHSCRCNPTIDFFILTDDRTYTNLLPSNVELVYTSIEEINTRATRKLGFATNITAGYKLCDFKPAYGFIFDDLGRDYDFWGHGDIDVIFGDIRAFMTNEVLAAHDVISLRHDYLTGQFVLFRNNEQLVHA